jgi:hypothetical protein
LKRTVLASTLAALLTICVLVPRLSVARYEFPLLAEVHPPAEASGDPSAASTSAVTTVQQPWLHVELETKYAWIYQKSIARAWTTVSKDDTTRVNVGKLCLQLDAYTEQKVCWADTSYIELTDIKRRVATKKKVAVATAWAEEPVLDSVRVEMTP